MADRRATNKYYPPDWDPSKGSLNQYHGQHALRERARKLNQGILIVRFELPFNIWCEGCDNHIGTGVRYNAEKKKIGNYYSTPILSFRMKCHLCANWIEIHTDPKVLVKNEADKERREKNAFAQLEHGVEDKRKAASLAQRLTDIQTLNDKQWSSPDDQSSRLRKRFRTEKKVLIAKKKEADEIRERNSLTIPIVPESEEDVIAAKSISFGETLQEEQAKQRKLTAHALPLFRNTRSTKRQLATSKSNLAQQIILNTRRKMDPFLTSNSFTSSSRSTATITNGSGGGGKSSSLDGLVKRSTSSANTSKSSK
ncbi:coiled-coil domain-containing protein 130-like protein [Syncephalis plumigaleata]|nr:coiled-coil domain-containing protein 130-like protein [Syncephalis plumigaleata]